MLQGFHKAVYTGPMILYGFYTGLGFRVRVVAAKGRKPRRMLIFGSLSS